MSGRQYYVYIVSNSNNTVLYTGVTNDLERRMYEHKNKLIPGFTSKYNIWKLVWFEQSSDVLSAVGREKQVKDYNRAKKISLIEEINPKMLELKL